MEQNEPSAHPRPVRHLPNELMISIMDSLRLPVDDDPGAVKPPASYLQNRETLRNLCLTSKFFDGLARPLLYEIITFFVDPDYNFYDGPGHVDSAKRYGNLKSVVLLIRSLIEAPALRGLIKDILCPSKLEGEPWWRKDQYHKPFEHDGYPFGHPEDYSGIDIGWRLHRTIAERVFATLLCYTFNLETLLLRKDDSLSYDRLSGIISEAEKHELLAGSILPKFKTLRLQRTAASSDNYELAVPRSFQNFGNFTRLHLWRDRGIHRFPPSMVLFVPKREPQRLFHYLERLEEVKMVGGVLAIDVFQICQNATRLEKLHMIISRDFDRQRSLPAFRKDLNWALVRRAESLKVLEIRVCDQRWFTPQMGPSGSALWCIHKLITLEELTIEIPLLFRRESSESVKSLLPPNLVSLNLVESWRRRTLRQNRDSTMSPREFSENIRNTTDEGLVKSLLIRLGDACCKDPPTRLKNICFLYSPEWPCIHLDFLHASQVRFKDTGVNFTYKKDVIPSYYFA
ncbi:hypothetical protein AAE478_001944 [Parahypoxylon ruwenzoriense]